MRSYRSCGRAAADGPGLFLAGSLVTPAGVAAANVLGPPLVRWWFPHRAGAAVGPPGRRRRGRAIALVRAHAAGAGAELWLSGIVQTGGYTLAIAGPLATGVLRDATSGRTVPVTVVMILLVAQAVAGLVATRSAQPARYDSSRSTSSTGLLSATR